VSRRAAGLGALLALATLSASASAATVEVLRQTGPVGTRFNIAVLGDGYRTQDQTLLSQNAQAIIDYVFGVTPLKEYAGFFNVKLVHVVSNQNGADNGTYGTSRDTALGAYFNCGGIDRLLCIDDTAVQLAAAQDVPEYNFAIVLVNDPKYGGSGGPVGVSSSNEQSFEVLAHELGHSLADLADEYDSSGNQGRCSTVVDCPEANATVRTTRSEIKWNAWIDAATPLPTPATVNYANVVGLFEGARYFPDGQYRPQLDCKMRDLGVPYCPVCSEQFVRSIWSADNVQMIESTVPAQSNFSVDDCAPIDLSIGSPPIVPSTYAYAWKVDGTALATSTNATQLIPAALGPGQHKVIVNVKDTTALVRSDPSGLLDDSFTWNLQVNRSDCGSTGGTGGGGTSSGGTSSGGTTTADGGSAGDSAAEGGVGGLLAEGGESAGGAAGAPSLGGAADGGASGSPAGLGGAESETDTAGTSGGPVAGSAPSGGQSPAGSGVGTAPPPSEKTSCSCSVPGQARRDAFELWGLAAAAVLLRRRGNFKRPRARA
jgi:hypothetical protein